MAGTIKPIPVAAEVLTGDIPVMGGLTLALLVWALVFAKQAVSYA